LRVLAVSQNYLPQDLGGASRSIHTILSHLTSKGHKCAVLCETGAVRMMDGVTIHGVGSEDLDKELAKIVKGFKPDVILTQQRWVASTLKLNIPLVIFIRSEIVFKFCPDVEGRGILVANSTATLAEIKKRWSRHSIIIPPVVDLKNYEVSAINEGGAITFINPIEKKGRDTFAKIVRSMPKRRFLSVQLREAPMVHPLVTKMDDMAEGLKIDGHLLLKVTSRFDRFLFYPHWAPNHVLLSPQKDMRKVYSQTRLLLVPSKWSEPFGRVILEAGISGIPVLASAVGGIPDFLPEECLVRDYLDHNVWMKRIEELDDVNTFKRFSRISKNVADGFSLERTAEKVDDLLSRINTAKQEMGVGASAKEIESIVNDSYSSEK